MVQYLPAALGAEVRPGPTTRFSLFSTRAQRCAVRLFREPDAPDGALTLPMHARGDGLFELSAEDVGHGALYKFVLDDRELPDPYARYLPHGVHGPAMVVEPRYVFRHPRPASPPPGQRVIYELHVGTFTEHGTYAAACLRLPQLAELGVSTLELMPVAAFAGARGWGYDQVAPFAPFAGYGTPDELRALIDSAHGLGLTVLLDVVYNHFGPAGNYLGAYCPEYFSSTLRNAWGDAPDFSFAPMRALTIDNARYWLEEFRFDGLRLDAVHAIIDPSPRHVTQELIAEARQRCPQAVIIAEDDRNDPRLVSELGFDAIWADDFHHQLHVTLSGERDGYYAGYEPGAAGLARAIERGWLYEGETFPASGKARGRPAPQLSADAFVYCTQNHDQVGNRALGERLSQQVSLDAYCLATSLLLFLPMTPLLFMGQEWAASSPFLYFTDHEPELGSKVVQGRREEFKGFAAFSDPAARERIPDPQALGTFERSKLRWEERTQEPHGRVLALYRALLALRRNDPVLANAGRAQLSARAHGPLLEVRRTLQGQARTLWANLSAEPAQLPPHAERGRVLLGELGAQALLAAWSAVIVTSDAAG